ncbi:MAG: prohibitin family protein [Rhodospirillaceae bacterium]
MTVDAQPEPGSIPLRDRLRRYEFPFLVALLCLSLLVLALAPKIFIQIPAGHVGVLWLRFLGGTVTERVFPEGVRLIFPWDQMIIYDARLKSDTRVYHTMSSNGLAMEIEVSLRYRINPAAAGLLHKLAGSRYDETLVIPEVAAVALEMFANYTPEQVYSELRGKIQADVRTRVLMRFAPPSNFDRGNNGNVLRPNLVEVENVLVRSITLPPTVREAIERKFEQQQRMLEYDFRIAREEKERERKKIEAEGIRFFQDTVASTITPEYLRLRGIEATNSFAASPNSKIIIIGGKDGLPVILNTAEAESRPAHSPLATVARPSPGN